MSDPARGMPTPTIAPDARQVDGITRCAGKPAGADSSEIDTGLSARKAGLDVERIG
ncbi:hypothetical protein [Amycolatopsis sp. VC5-11]|uniref:hypothetical protein n=1 Tax=Amycolatopsis sp. VC5-11 TaxID=3120156 RepID=UPI00300AAA83